jgi:translation initiation factor 2B subunit (eIF-2B alpha/beta/delta family)
MIRDGSEPYLDQLLRHCRWRENTRLRDDARDQIRRLLPGQYAKFKVGNAIRTVKSTAS